MDTTCKICKNEKNMSMFRPQCGHHICFQCFFQNKYTYCLHCNKNYDFALKMILNMYISNENI